MPTPVPSSTKYLDIEGFALFCAAWHTETLAPIERPADRRGEDTLIPGAGGVKANPRRVTLSERTLPMKFFGDYDCTGAPLANAATGLEDNLDLFVASVVTPGLDLVTATLHRWDGNTKSAEIHIEDFDWTELDPGVAVATLVLSIPVGAFA